MEDRRRFVMSRSIEVEYPFLSQLGYIDDETKRDNIDLHDILIKHLEKAQKEMRKKHGCAMYVCVWPTID